MSNKIGRNDPCPCGSGNKYKHCCLGKISVMTDPNILKQNPYDDNLYQPMNIAENNESLLMQKIVDLMSDIIPNKPLSGIEVSKYFQELTDWVNDPEGVANLDFTPIQVMNSFLNTLDDLPELFELNSTFTGEDIADVPLMQYLAYLLFLHTQESGGVLELTAKGNYRPSTVLKFNSYIYEDSMDLSKVTLEDSSYNLQLAHQLIIDLGLVEETVRKSCLTTEGLQAALHEDLSRYYSKVVQLFFDDFDWIGYSYLEVLDVSILDTIQDTALFSLKLLARNAEKYISNEDLYGKFIRAFPFFDKILKNTIAKPNPSYFYYYIFILRFCLFLGLIEQEETAEQEETVDADSTKHDYSTPRIRITPLFQKLFLWKV